MENDIQTIKSLLQNKKLGEKAHREMISYDRETVDQIIKSRSDYRESAVLILLYFKNGEWYFPLTERNAYKGVHSKQISLPGGKLETSDASFWDCAIRETREEIGFKGEVKLLAQLTEVYIPPSKFIVYPFVGFTTDEPTFVKDVIEVKEIIEASVKEDLHPSRLKETGIQIGDNALKTKVKYFDIDNRIVWGATSMILNEFRLLLQSK